MSAEAPKNTGITAPVTPQRPEGGFSRFLRRFVTGVSEPQPIPQSKPSVIQPPLGLENFAAGIKQGIDGLSASIRQQELDRQNAEITRQAAEINVKTIAEQRQKELDQKRATVLTEGKRVLNELRVEEKLRYINDTQWGGMGKVRPVEPRFACGGDSDYCNGNRLDNRVWDFLGGFELVYFYPAYGTEEQYRQRGGHSYDRRRNVPIRVSTKLQVVVWTSSMLYEVTPLEKMGWPQINEFEDIPKVVMENILQVKSDDPKPGKDFSVNGGGENKNLEIKPGNIIMQFPTNDANRNDLLDQTLAKETLERVGRGNMPAQLESRGNQELERLQKEKSTLTTTQWHWSVWYHRCQHMGPGNG